VRRRKNKASGIVVLTAGKLSFAVLRDMTPRSLRGKRYPHMQGRHILEVLPKHEEN
jgi:hypothetical protein